MSDRTGGARNSDAPGVIAVDPAAEQAKRVRKLKTRAAILLAGGTPGKRAALPNSRVLIHQPATQGTQGQVSDLEIQAAEIERMRRLMEDTLAHHTGRTSEQVRIDTDRDKILTAEEAKDYGIIDTVFDYRKLSAGN